MSSINFNSAATQALRTLQTSNSQLDATQKRISTGLAIGEAKDNAAYWSISTTMTSDNKALSTVTDALGLGAATVDTAYQGLTAAKDVLDEIKSKLTAALGSNVDRTAIQSEINSLQDQLKSIASSSTFSGENWLSVNSSLTAYSADKTVVSSFTRDVSGNVVVGEVKIDTRGAVLFDDSASAGATGILDGKTALTTKVNGVDTALTFGGKDGVGNASSAGLDLSTAVAGKSTTAGSAVYKAGAFSTTDLKAGDTVSFQVSLDGSSTFSTVSFKTTETNIASDTAFAAAINTALGQANPALGRTLNAAIEGGQIVIKDTVSGGDKSITVKNFAAADGDGVFTQLVNTTGVGVSLATSKTNTVAAGGTTSGVATFAAIDFTKASLGDEFSFTVTTSNSPSAANDVTKTVSFSLADNTDADFVAKINAKLDAAFGAGKVVAAISGGALTITNAVVADVSNPSGITVSAMTVADTNGELSSLGGLKANATGTTVTGYDVSASAAAGSTSFDFKAVTLDADDTIKFDVSVDGASGTTVTIDKARVTAALGAAANGEIKSADDFVKVLNLPSTILPAGVSVTAKEGKVVLTSTTTGGASSVGISNVAVSGGATGSAQAISVDQLDITDATLTSLGADTADKRVQAITAYINVVNAAMNKVTAAATSIGAVGKRIETQQTFVQNLMDTIQKGISGLVDADMNEESTKLQALQVKQQLGVQALSIANQSAQNVLSLFRG